MSIMLAGDFQPLYLVLAVHGVEPGGQPELDVSGSGHLLAELRDAAKLVFEVDNGQLLGEGGQVQRLFHGTVRSAHYIDVLSGVSGAVPGGVHAHTLAGQFRLAGDTQLPGRAAACQNDPLGLIGSLVGGDGLNVSRQRHAGDICVDDLHAGPERLFLHPGGKGGAGLPGLDGGVVGNGRNLADDAAHLALFQNQCLLAAADCIDTCADACGACSDDEDVVHD